MSREIKFYIATKKELSKELLEQKFNQYFDSETFPIKKAVKIIYDNIQFEGLVQSSDDGFEYFFNKVLKKQYGFENFFEKIGNKSFKYFYPGSKNLKEDSFTPFFESLFVYNVFSLEKLFL